MDQQQPTAAIAAAAAQSQAKPLSCTNCRARKLRCTREYPCHHCLRTGAACVFPARKRIRKPRRNKNSELLQRLSRLESIVGEVGLSELAQENGDGKGRRGGVAAVPGSGSVLPPSLIASGVNASYLADDPSAQTAGAGTSGAAQQQQQQRKDEWHGAMPDSKASQYLSGEFWSSLCGEVEGLRQALEQSTDSDDSDDSPSQEATPESNDHSSPGGSAAVPPAFSPGMLLGSGASRLTADAVEHHPPPDHIRFLAATFFANVDMIIKILHRPTVEPALLALADAPRPELRPQLDPAREALVFAIYHAAVASISDAACVAHLGQRRDDLVRSYAAAFEHLLVRADYLASERLELLQALTLYVACVRSTCGSRASWALLALPVRLAQVQGLHHESGNAGRSPYEAELRRRLWWQLIVLDIRAAEDRGSTTVVARDSYDARLPLNLDDADFGPSSPAPLVERGGPTDVTFSLCTARFSGIFLYVEHAHGAVGLGGIAGGGDSGSSGGSAEVCAAAPPPSSVEEIVRHAQNLEAQFVATADPAHAPSYLASVMVRLVILKMWLIMQYPLHPRPRPRPASHGQVAGIFPSDATLRTAISIVQLNEYLRTGPYGDRFSWWADTYVQWHPLAVALAELCSQTRGELADRAWRIIDDGFPTWSLVIADAKSGTLWRPIRKLYKKAKAARNAAAGGSTNVAMTNATTTTATTTTIPTREAGRQGHDTDSGTVFVRTDLETRNEPPHSGINNTNATATTINTTTTPEPLGAYQMDVNRIGEPNIPPDLDMLSRSPYSLSQAMWSWGDLNYNISFMDMGVGPGGPNPAEWSAWDDFVTEAQAGGQLGAGSSEGDL